MKRKFCNLASSALIVISCFTLASCDVFIHVDGNVVDKLTQAPLNGVAWKFGEGYQSYHSGIRNTINVTDSAGYFSVIKSMPATKKAYMKALNNTTLHLKKDGYKEVVLDGNKLSRNLKVEMERE